MTFSLLFTVAAGLAMAAAQISVDMPQIKTEIEAAKHKCADQLGIDWSLHDESFENYGVNDELKHFYVCFFQEMGAMTPDGTMTFIEGFPKREEVQACADLITETDISEKALQCRKCVNRIVG